MKTSWSETGGYILIVTAACFWGASASLGKVIMQGGLSTAMLMQSRSVISFLVLAILLAIIAPRHLKIRIEDLWGLFLLAVPGLVLVNASYYYAVKVLPVAIAVFIQFTAPVLVFIYGVLSKKERSNRRKVAALLLSITGTYFMLKIDPSKMGHLPILGLVSAAISMLTYAFYILISHHLGEKHSSWTMIVYGYGIASIFWCLYQSIPETADLLTKTHLWKEAILFSFFSTLIPFSLFLLGLRRVTATGAAIASTSESVTASLFAFIFLGEKLSWYQVVGGGLILTAVVILILQKSRKIEPEEFPGSLTV
jgi:drug/metabolite transporter (DMT)-like permease